MPIDDLESYYVRLRKKAEYDPASRERLNALETTLSEFNIIHMRSEVAGTLICADDLVSPDIKLFLDWENQHVQLMYRYLTRFKVLQGKEVPTYENH